MLSSMTTRCLSRGALGRAGRVVGSGASGSGLNREQRAAAESIYEYKSVIYKNVDQLQPTRDRKRIDESVKPRLLGLSWHR